jgi:hypothetical protein
MLNVQLAENEPGIFTGTTAAMISGVYHARVMAQGVTFRGAPFTREHTASLAVWKGGDEPYHPPRDRADEGWCRLLSCILGEKNFTREFETRLKEAGVNLDGIRRCVQLCNKQ